MLTPLDVENKRFSKKYLNGYNVEEVDEFLDELTVDYEKIYKENAELKDKIVVLEDSVKHYKTIEDTLQNTLVMAQSTADEVKSVAQAKADQIIAGAQTNAQKSVEELNSKIIIKKQELSDLKKEIGVYKAKMESLLISQLELLKDINKEDEE